MKVFFIQSGFVSQGGHYLLETRAWREAVLADGLAWHGYANGALDRNLAEQEQVTPLFPHPTQAVIDPDSVSRPITDLLYLSEQFASAAALMPEVAADSLVIVQFATCNEIYALARWLNGVPLARRPRVALLFHIPDPDWNYSRHNDTFSGSIALWRFAINQLKVALPRDRIYLAAIDARLARFLSTFLEMPVDVTPLVVYFDGALLSKPFNKRFDVLFAGGLRVEKGAPLLMKIIELFEQQPRDTPLRIALQLDTLADANIAHAAFGGASNVLLDVVSEPLSASAYLERLTASRVAVLPYQASAYAMRGSGVAAEAFGYGIPVVAPTNSWISDRLADGYGAGIGFDSLSAENVSSATLSALRQLQPLAASARNSAGQWRDDHNATLALRRIRHALSI